MDDSWQGGSERRVFMRASFRSEAVFFPFQGGEVRGRTKDVGFANAIILTPTPPPDLPVDEPGRVHIGLDDKKSVDVCFAPFSCRVIRCTQQGIALKFSPLVQRWPVGSLVRSKIAIRRSSGILELGWEILHPHEPVPPSVAAKVQAYILHHQHEGPMALCFKRGKNVKEDLYRIHNIRYLKEVQLLAGTDPEKRKFFSTLNERL